MNNEVLKDARQIADRLLALRNDAQRIGWMLREMGKHVSMDLLRSFLHQHAHEMPRTMLRYAIEKFNKDERRDFMTRRTPLHVSTEPF